MRECPRCQNLDNGLQVAMAKVAELRAENARLRAALKGVSPWNLQDCWCVEPDRREKAGPDQHRPECMAARDALKRTA